MRKDRTVRWLSMAVMLAMLASLFVPVAAQAGIAGDMDQNGVTDTDDAIYLLQHVLMPEVFPLQAAGDMDQNGITDTDDAIYLLQHVLMPGLFPLPDLEDSPDVSTATPEEQAFANAEIRKAISLLLDRNYIVESITQMGELPANTFVGNGALDFDGSSFSGNAGAGNAEGYYSVDPEKFEHNLSEAVEILKKYYTYDATTGKFTNFPALHYTYNSSTGHTKIAEYIQAALSAVGIPMTLESQDWNTFLNNRKDGNYTFARSGWLSDYSDPICFLDQWTTDYYGNDAQFGKDAHATVAIYDLDLTDYGYADIKVEDGTWAETYDVLISTIKACTDSKTRYALMHIAEDMLMSTGCLMPLYYYSDLYMLNPRVQGFYSNPLGYKYFQNATVDGKNDSLSVCLGSEPYTLDPALNSSVDGSTMLNHLFSGLAKWSQDEEGNLVIVADSVKELVEGVVNEDGTVTYTYTLKDGLKWSDGKPLSAKDFAFAWKRAASSELWADYGYLFEVVKGYGTDNKDDLAVKAIDDKTLEVTLNEAVSYWNELLASPISFPVREDVVANENWANDAATYICNGAYTLSNWEHDSVITMTKNEHYHGAATMNTLNFYLSDDFNQMLDNYADGYWMFIDDVPTHKLPTLKADYPNELVITGQVGTYYVCWNINKSLLPE